jgi:Ser/Thr protein kinase RdoA (MazF antagonist)
MSQDAPYERLSPDAVIHALEGTGLCPDGRILALNSYENRVYQIGIEDAAPVVAKFYRPQRWSDAAILEEHAFAWELAEAEIPVVPPLRFDGRSLLESEGYRFAVFERRGGRWPELGRSEEREWMGRFLGRMHVKGRAGRFMHRRRLDAAELGQAARDAVLEGDWMPDYLAEKYAEVTQQIIDEIAWCTVTAIVAMCCGQIPVRILWIWMTAAPDLRCRTCGCYCPAGLRKCALR